MKFAPPIDPIEETVWLGEIPVAPFDRLALQSPFTTSSQML
jgi:hypothetical protein